MVDKILKLTQDKIAAFNDPNSEEQLNTETAARLASLVTIARRYGSEVKDLSPMALKEFMWNMSPSKNTFSVIQDIRKICPLEDQQKIISKLSKLAEQDTLFLVRAEYV